MIGTPNQRRRLDVLEAYLVADVAERVALILPQLSFYDIQDVILLGPDDWNDPRLVEIAGRDARGADSREGRGSILRESSGRRAPRCDQPDSCSGSDSSSPSSP